MVSPLRKWKETQKYSSKALLALNLRIFIFATKFAIIKIRRWFLGPKFKDFYFRTKRFFKTIFLFYAFIICVLKDSCIYWNQTQITKGEK